MAARIDYWCEHCMKVHRAGEECPKRKAARKARRDTRKQCDRDASRRAYGDPEYQRNRQLVWEMQRGRCNRCRKLVAEKRKGRWRAFAGGVHHKVPLSKGGTNRLSNLEGLCIPCHNHADAALRK